MHNKQKKRHGFFKATHYVMELKICIYQKASACTSVHENTVQNYLTQTKWEIVVWKDFWSTIGK